ncbi:MAG TPA: acyltransferase [Steroidobacteraceae bacterium]|nr:acyltransferase [Steroidobacteraceae bacterium]
MPAIAAEPAQGGWTRLDGVDLLRSVAILLVLMNHTHLRLLFAHVPYTAGLPAQLVSSLMWNGQYGVQIFFAVSGFLITSISLRRWGSPSGISLYGFYRLRLARIAPLLLLLLAVLSALDLAHVHNYVVPARTGGLGAALLAALTFHINLLEAHRGYLPGNWDVLWSLSIEEAFYLAFPLICAALGRGRLLLGVLCVVVALGPVGRTLLANGSEIWREYSYLGGMDAIALGCLTAMMLARVPPGTAAYRWLGGAGGWLGAALLSFSLGCSTWAKAWGLQRSGLDMSLIAAGTCLLAAAAACSRRRGAPLMRPLLLLGRRSYEIYLTHMFVVFTLFGWFVRAGEPIRAVPLLFVAVILIAAALGEVVARLYSEPMNRLLRGRLGRLPPVAAVIGSPRNVHDVRTTSTTT